MDNAHLCTERTTELEDRGEVSKGGPRDCIATGKQIHEQLGVEDVVLIPFLKQRDFKV